MDALERLKAKLAAGKDLQAKYQALEEENANLRARLFEFETLAELEEEEVPMPEVVAPVVESVG